MQSTTSTTNTTKVTLWICLLILVMAFWGGSFIAIKIVVQHVTPLELVPMRFVPVALIFGAWLVTKHSGILWPMIRAEGWRLAIIGLTGAVLYNIFLGWGETRVPAGTASLIIALNPAFIYSLSMLCLREPLIWRRIMGMVIAFGGLFIIIRFGSVETVGLDNLVYAFIVMLAPVMWSIYTVLGKSVVERHPPLLVTGISMLFAGAFSLIFVSGSLLARLPEVPASFWWSVFFLALPCTVFGFAVWFGALERLPAGRVAGFVYCVPMFGVFFSQILLDEPITIPLVIGAAVLIGGVWLVNRR